MLDGTRSKPIQHENCVDELENVASNAKQTAQRCCIGTYISLRHHTFTYVY